MTFNLAMALPCALANDRLARALMGRPVVHLAGFGAIISHMAAAALLESRLLRSAPHTRFQPLLKHKKEKQSALGGAGISFACTIPTSNS
jgi:hypothetical protein